MSFWRQRLSPFRPSGGGVKHHEKMEELAHASHVGKIAGSHSKGHKGRAARAAGGKTGSNRRRPPPRSPWPAGG